jgi:hypothetical protein
MLRVHTLIASLALSLRYPRSPRWRNVDLDPGPLKSNLRDIWTTFQQAQKSGSTVWQNCNLCADNTDKRSLQLPFRRFLCINCRRINIRHKHFYKVKHTVTLGRLLSPEHGASSSCGRRAAANTLNKQSRANDKEWSVQLGGWTWG